MGTYILDGDDVAGSGKVTPHDSGSHFIPANIPFANLAAAMFHPYFQKTIDLCLSTIVHEVAAAVDDGTSLLGHASATQKGGINMVATTASAMPRTSFLKGSWTKPLPHYGDWEVLSSVEHRGF